MKRKSVLILFLLLALAGCQKTYEDDEEVMQYLNENYDFLQGELVSLKYMYTDCSDRSAQFIRYLAVFPAEEKRIIKVNVKMKRHLFHEGPDFVIKDVILERPGQFYDSSFVYAGQGFGSDFYITIRANGSFTYYEGVLSSHIGAGYYDLDDSELTLYESDGRIYVFIVCDDVLIYQKDISDSFSLDIGEDACFYKKNGALTGE